MIDGVIAGKLIAAFVDGPIKHPGLEGMPVFDEEMLVVAPSHHTPIWRGQDAHGEMIYVFRDNCSYLHHFERWFAVDGAVSGVIRELESYHSMLVNMPGGASVSAWPMDGDFARLNTWLVWRSDSRSRSLELFRQLVEEQAAALDMAGI